MKYFLFILLLILVGCGSMVLVKRCDAVQSNEKYYVCDKLGWFE